MRQDGGTALEFSHSGYCLCGMPCAPYVHLGFLWVLQFVPNAPKHAARQAGW